jgi:hypothetical protein
LYEELHGRIQRSIAESTASGGYSLMTEAYKLLQRRKVTFMKKEYFANPLIAYAFHWLAYHGWLLESRRQRSCIQATNTIMCPEVIILMSVFKHHSCPLCGSLQPQPTLQFHAADAMLLAYHKQPSTAHNVLLSDELSEDKQHLAHEKNYLNQKVSALFVSKDMIQPIELEPAVEEMTERLTLAGNGDSSVKITCLMQLERLENHESGNSTVSTIKYVHGPPKQRKIAVVGSRDVGTLCLSILTHRRD